MQKAVLAVVGLSLVAAALVIFLRDRMVEDTPVSVATGGEPFSLGKPLSHWTAELKSESPEARRRGAQAIGLLGKQAVPAIPALLEALDDKTPDVRNVVIDTLVAIGPKGRTAAPKIAELLKDPDPTVRGKAAESLGRMRIDDPAIVTALTERLNDDTLSVRVFSAESLRQIDPKSLDGVPVLLAILDSEDQAVCAQAAHALFAFGVDAKPALPRLIEAHRRIDPRPYRCGESDLRLGPRPNRPSTL